MHSLNCKLLYRTKLALSKTSWSGIRHPRVAVADTLSTEIMWTHVESARVQV